MTMMPLHHVLAHVKSPVWDSAVNISQLVSISDDYINIGIYFLTFSSWWYCFNEDGVWVCLMVITRTTCFLSSSFFQRNMSAPRVLCLLTSESLFRSISACGANSLFLMFLCQLHPELQYLSLSTVCCTSEPWLCQKCLIWKRSDLVCWSLFVFTVMVAII